MRRPTPWQVTVVAAAAAVTTVLVVRDPLAGPAEWVFGTVVLSLAGLVIITAAAAWRRARAEHRRARLLAASRPDEVARAAIHEERRRLSREIALSLRAMMADVAVDARDADPADPLPSLRRIHRRAAVATSELRRHLGLLRSPDEPAPATEVAPISQEGIPRRDLLLGAGLAALAVVEVTVYLLMEGPRAWLPWSAVFSAVAAASIATRTVAPAAGCAWCAATYVGAWLAGQPVMGGFWAFGTLGGLLWAVLSRPRIAARDALGAALLVVAVGWTVSLSDPVNLPFMLTLIGAAVTIATVVRVARLRELRARTRASAREDELQAAAREAVSAERAGFARDLHDVVSHAVGLIALQSSAAQVSWPHDPAAVHRSLGVIEATARATLDDLDRLGPTGHDREPGTEALAALVSRICATGAEVGLEVRGELPPGLGSVVHRVVQEGLTNAVRHAPGARVQATVSCEEHQVVVSVRDHGAGPGPSATRGYGLVGLAERVSLAGGTLTAGAGDDGGFVVHACLPTPSEAVAS